MMGGVGSGRWRAGETRLVLERADYLDVWQLAHQGVLQAGVQSVITWRAGQSSAVVITLTCTQREGVLTCTIQRRGAEGSLVSQAVVVAQQVGSFGTRVFWQCSACGRRIVRLYDGPSGVFLCRHCLHLPYASQSEAESERLRRRLVRLRQRLGLVGGDVERSVWSYGRPWGMHQHVYERLGRQAEDVRMQLLAVLQEELARQLSHYLTFRGSLI